MQKRHLSAVTLAILALFAVTLFVAGGYEGSNSARTLLEDNSASSKRDFFETYDYVIVGAGPAGSQLANKLAKNSGYSILVLEAGNAHYPDDLNVDDITAYGGKWNSFENNTATSNDGRYSWPTFLQPDSTTFGVRSLIGSGKAVGGGSAINAGMFVVGGSYVWDNYWPSSWRYSVMKPYVQSVVNWVAPYCGVERFPPTITWLKAVRNISLAQQSVSNTDFFINRATPGVSSFEDPAYPNSVDYNDVAGLNSVTAYGQWQVYQHKINDTYFERVYGGDLLLNNSVLDRQTLRGKGVYSGLRLVTGATVNRIVFRSHHGKNTAVGVEYVVDGITLYVSIRKEVILTAGTFFSPGILQRSGVGNFARLTTLGVKDLVYNNPLVGKNFRNHYSPSTNVVGSGNATDLAAFFTQFNGNLNGYPYLRGGGFASYHSLDPARPASGPSSPRKYQLFVTAKTIVQAPAVVSQFNLGPTAAQSMSFIADNIHFDAFGTVEIAHPTDPTVIPNLFYNVFPAYVFNSSATPASQFVNAAATEKNGISSLLGLNILFQCKQQMNKQLQADGKNITLSFAMPLEGDMATFDAGLTRLGANWYQKIWSWNPASTATAQDNAFYTAANNILNVMRAAAHLDSHQNGSNKIGDVVDEQLKVIGVDGVRVADLSVAAVPPGGNTATTAFIIASRAADLILNQN